MTSELREIQATCPKQHAIREAGASDEIRTRDLFFTKEVLYP
jgi:hypothetical protein